MDIFSFVLSARSGYLNFNTLLKVDIVNFNLKVKYELFTAFQQDFN